MFLILAVATCWV